MFSPSERTARTLGARSAEIREDGDEYEEDMDGASEVDAVTGAETVVEAPIGGMSVYEARVDQVITSVSHLEA
jgi:hypothetical protein